MKKCKKCDKTCSPRSKNWCEEHLNESIRKTMKRRQEKSEKGQCRDCDKQISTKSTTYCDDHLEKYKNIRRTRVVNGLCRDCGATAVAGIGFCPAHIDRHNKTCKKAMKKPSNKYNRLKKAAERRSLEFNLTMDEFIEWHKATKRQCYYCEIDETLLKTSQKPRAFMSIDRKDNNQGYEINNICLCCYRCNNKKGAFFTEEDWLKITNEFVKPRIKEYHHIG